MNVVIEDGTAPGGVRGDHAYYQIQEKEAYHGRPQLILPA
jgi:hypothetical protein